MMRYSVFLISSVVLACAWHRIESRETRCFAAVGCFSSFAELPVPQSPAHIATTFRMHVRGTSQPYNLAALNYQSHIPEWASHFDSSKKTKVIIHGFIDSGATAWLPKLSAELLKKGDFNVIIVDWGHGSITEYTHAAANTFVVAAETVLLLKYLHSNNALNYGDVHIIGHSLGAQTAGHIGHSIPHLGRITGLDPADPSFTGKPLNKRLDAADADFVDVIHTDASIFNIISGYGTRDAVGDIDFYPNGGDHQPGCTEHPVSGAIGSVLTGSLTGAKYAVTCSHARSRELFIESINSLCKFYAHTCPSGDTFEAGSCLGCPSGGCPVMGYDADKNIASRGTFYLSTSGLSPFCGHEYFVDIKTSDWMFSTHGEFMITLVGTNGKTEPLKFESRKHTLDHGREEKHVISTHNDIGTVTSVQLQFLKSHDIHGLLSPSYIKVHSIIVEPAETATKTIFCAHEQHFSSGHTVSVSSHSGC